MISTVEMAGQTPHCVLHPTLAILPQEALVLLGMLCAKNKDRLPALSKFKRALELNPRLSDAWIAQAQVSVVHMNACSAVYRLTPWCRLVLQMSRHGCTHISLSLLSSL